MDPLVLRIADKSVVPPLLVTSCCELGTTQLLWCVNAKEGVDKNGVLRTGDFTCMYSCSVCWGYSYHCTCGTSFASQSQEFHQKVEHKILWCEVPNKVCEHNSSWVMHLMTKGTEIFVVLLLSTFPYKINGVKPFREHGMGYRLKNYCWNCLHSSFTLERLVALYFKWFLSFPCL